MEITCPEVARLIELNKKKAELEFSSGVLGIDTAKETNAVLANIEVISARMRNAGIEILTPHKIRLEQTAKKIGEFNKDELKKSFLAKNGAAFDALKERGLVVRKNYENRFEIAKLTLLAHRLAAHERAVLCEAVYFGRIETSLELNSIAGELIESLGRILSRCGIYCSVLEGKLRATESSDTNEHQYKIQNRTLWLDHNTISKLDTNEKKIRELMPFIQLKNAERQIRKFNDQEETEFTSAQHKYLALLKEQDEILNKSQEEETRLAITVSN